MDRSERKLLAITNLGHFAIHYNMMVFPALVAPLAVSMGLPLASVVELAFLHYLFFGISALPWGFAGDKWGGRALMLVLFLGSGVSGLACMFSLDSPGRLAYALGALGLFSGVYHPIGMGLISKGVREISLGLGYNAVAGGVGQVMGPLVTGIVCRIWGLEAAFVAVAALNFAGAAFMLTVPFPQGNTQARVEAAAAPGMIGGFLILLTGMMLAGLAYSASTVLLPAYLELKSEAVISHITVISGGLVSGTLLVSVITALVYSVGAVGQYCGGIAGSRFNPRWAYLVFHAMCIPAAFLMAYTYNVPLALAASVYFFFLLGMQPLENTLVARLTPPGLRHSAYGLKFILAFGVGSLGVKFAGWMQRAWGIEAVFVALGFLSIVIVFVAVMLIVQGSRSERIGHKTAAEQV